MKMLLLLFFVTAKAQKYKREDFAPSVLEPGCPREISTCIIQIHANALRCQNMAEPLNSRKCGSDYEAKREKWLKASARWHSDMQECIRGVPAPTFQPMLGREKRQVGKVHRCWAEAKLAQEKCISLMLQRCPRLSACMGWGDYPEKPEHVAWYLYMRVVLGYKKAVTRNLTHVMQKGDCWFK